MMMEIGTNVVVGLWKHYDTGGECQIHWPHLYMVDKNITKDCSSKSESQKVLLLYMIILQNCHGLVNIYLIMMKDNLLENMGQHVNAVTPLNRIAMFQVLGLELFYNPHLELDQK